MYYGFNISNIQCHLVSVLAPKCTGHEICGFVRDLYLFRLGDSARRKFGRSPNEEAQHAVG